MKFDYDAVIIGAGTSGMAAGIALQKAGKRYIILDRKKEIGVPVRSTGAVSLEWVKRIGMPTDRSIVASDIYSMSFRTDTGKAISMSFDRPVGLVYDFTKYEKFLATGVAGKLNIQLETMVNSVSENSVETSKGTFTGKYIIFAVGPQSAFGKKLPKDQYLVAYEETRRLPARKDHQMILWFSDMAPGGYFWDFADSDSTRKIGVCYYPLQSSQPKNILQEFSEKFTEVSGEPLHSMAHQIPLGAPAESVFDHNRMYVGDMVNAVLNTTAGGLQGAYWTGISAGKAVVENDPSAYQKVWDLDIRPWLMRHHELHRKIHKQGARSVGRYITLAKIMPKSMKKRVFGGL